MRHLCSRRRAGEAGFSLPEIAVAIAIILVLTVIAFQMFWGGGATEKARVQAATDTIIKIRDAASVYLRETGKTNYDGLTLGLLVNPGQNRRGYLPPAILGTGADAPGPWPNSTYSLTGAGDAFTVRITRVPSENFETMQRTLRMQAYSVAKENEAQGVCTVAVTF